MAHKIKRLVILSLGLWLVTAGFGEQWAEAAAGNKSSSYSRPARSYSKPASSYSKPASSPSRTVWGSRSGGGSYGGYAKPAAPAAGSCSKPAAPAGGGYTKPATSQTAHRWLYQTSDPCSWRFYQAGGPRFRRLYQAGHRPDRHRWDHLQQTGWNQPPAPSGGYAKPGRSKPPAVDPARAARVATATASAPIGSKFDEKLVQSNAKTESCRVLEGLSGGAAKIQTTGGSPQPG